MCVYARLLHAMGVNCRLYVHFAALADQASICSLQQRNELSRMLLWHNFSVYRAFLPGMRGQTRDKSRQPVAGSRQRLCPIQRQRSTDYLRNLCLKLYTSNCSKSTHWRSSTFTCGRQTGLDAGLKTKFWLCSKRASRCKQGQTVAYEVYHVPLQRFKSTIYNSKTCGGSFPKQNTHWDQR